MRSARAGRAERAWLLVFLGCVVVNCGARTELVAPSGGAGAGMDSGNGAGRASGSRGSNGAGGAAVSTGAATACDFSCAGVFGDPDVLWEEVVVCSPPPCVLETYETAPEPPLYCFGLDRLTSTDQWNACTASGECCCYSGRSVVGQCCVADGMAMRPPPGGPASCWPESWCCGQFFGASP